VTLTSFVFWTVLGLFICLFNLYLTTAVLHRGLCHRAIRYPAWLSRLVAAWLWLTVCVPPLTWIATHRFHHAVSDSEEDPHAPGRKGFLKVLLLTWYYVPNWFRSRREFAWSGYLKGFEGLRFLSFLDHPTVAQANFYSQVIVSVVLGPAAVVFWVARIVPYMILSGYVNAAGHTLGDRPYANLGTDARGLFQRSMAYLTAGEPLGHNYHHRFPASPSFLPNGFDPGFWFSVKILRGRPKQGRDEVRDPA